MEERDVSAVIDDVVRPVIRADGGDIHLLEVRGDVVRVRLSGSCAGCPGAPYTRSGLIEAALTKILGEAVRVELVRGK